jgi:hypothetical protein
MAQFNLNDYETVEERHARALALHPDLRCVTINHTTPQDRASGVWVVEARVYLDAADQEANLPKATDWAFEVDGQGMANKTSALENASTSALGRALRWALGGSKGPSQTEMAKVATGVTPKPARDWLKEAEALALTYNLDALRVLYSDAQATHAGKDVLDGIKGWADVAGKS